ncbi:MAG: PhzF family phenazine biosynthesis protein [Chloroflexota bacterium]
MTTYPFMQVDAFTDRPLGGNPCAILFDCAELPEATMQAIAKEMNLSETSFVWEKPDGHFRARYFTPAEEIPLAGHPTVATVYALVETGRLALSGDVTKIPLELRDGPIDVEIFRVAGKVDRVVMSQRKPKFLRTYTPEEVCPIFGLQPGDLLPGAPVQTVSTGTPQLFIPLKSLEPLHHIATDLPRFTAFHRTGDFFSVHLFCLQGVERGATFARHFAPPPDVFEDPFTGSASGGMGAYLWHHGLIDSPSFLAEQGHWMARPGIGTVEVIGPRQDMETVKVGGGAVTVIRGEIILP